LTAAKAIASPPGGTTILACGRPRNNGTDSHRRYGRAKAAAVRGVDDGTPPNCTVAGRCGRSTADCTNTARR